MAQAQVSPVIDVEAEKEIVSVMVEKNKLETEVKAEVKVEAKASM